MRPVAEFRVEESHVRRVRGLLWLIRKLRGRPTTVTVVDRASLTGITWVND